MFWRASHAVQIRSKRAFRELYISISHTHLLPTNFIAIFSMWFISEQFYLAVGGEVGELKYVSIEGWEVTA